MGSFVIQISAKFNTKKETNDFVSCKVVVSVLPDWKCPNFEIHSCIVTQNLSSLIVFEHRLVGCRIEQKTNVQFQLS